MIILNFYKTITAEQRSFSGMFLLGEATGDTFLRNGIPGMDWKLGVNVRHEVYKPHKSPKLELNYGCLLSWWRDKRGLRSNSRWENLLHMSKVLGKQTLTPEIHGTSSEFLTHLVHLINRHVGDNSVCTAAPQTGRITREAAAPH